MSDFRFKQHPKPENLILTYTSLQGIVSGGQNGVDACALRAACRLGIPTGGCAPKGWMTLDGPMPSLYTDFGLIQHSKPGYPPRTEENVKQSDATIRFAHDFNSTGERCTLNAIKKYNKPYLDIQVNEVIDKINQKAFLYFLNQHNVQVLNIAGNSAKRFFTIGKLVEEFLVETLTRVI